MMTKRRDKRAKVLAQVRPPAPGPDYTPIYEALEGIRRGDLTGQETLIGFLEADVYALWSGYLKAEIIHFLTRTHLDGNQLPRLRAVVLAAIDGHDRREFRSYIRLARRVDDPAFRAAIEARASSTAPGVARRADWVLAGLPSPRASRASNERNGPPRSLGTA